MPPAIVPDIPRPTRGLKNRNPGNLRANPSLTWEGQTGVDGKGFAVFDSDVSGIRAAVIDLHTHYVRDRETTILGLISDYAPPVENNTKAYADFVAHDLGCDPLAVITFGRPTAAALIRAIIHMEQGLQPYADDVIGAGVEATFQHFAGA